VTFTGVVLAGGRSRRMGRDKALVEVGGRPLAVIAADALRRAGASQVTVVGGDGSGLAGVGLAVRPDDHPGEGPLGAIVTALGSAPAGIVMVLACDLPRIDADTVAAVVTALDRHPAADVAAPRLDGRLQVLTAAYRTRIRSHLAAAFAAGERAPRRALDGVEVVAVEGLDPERLADVDRPDDLHRYARADPGRPGRRPPGSVRAATPERTPVSVPEIDVEALSELHAAGATILDVREPDEYDEAHVPGVILIPLGEVPERFGELPADGPVYVICRSGARSLRAAEFLIGQGVEAANVAGGTLAWIDSGRPVLTGGDPG
jgi:molybdopterin-guanine dinucleotide biosynthesis protein A/rhodanese-related sulfurtransferase